MSWKEETKKLLSKFRDTGIPTIILQDPVKKKPSITYTMLIINFALCLAALIGKVDDAFGGIEFNEAKELLWITGGLYFGRQFQKLTESDKDKEEK